MLCACVMKEERPKINNVNFHHRKLEKKEEIKLERNEWHLKQKLINKIKKSKAGSLWGKVKLINL